MHLSQLPASGTLNTILSGQCWSIPGYKRPRRAATQPAGDNPMLPNFLSAVSSFYLPLFLAERYLPDVIRDTLRVGNLPEARYRGRYTLDRVVLHLRLCGTTQTANLGP